MRELTLPGRLILLPGFGTDHRVFDKQRKAFGDRLETPDFINHLPNESISAYARRWAHQLSRPGDDRPLFLGGHSFGGMVALEMARHLTPRPRAVFLISSTTQGDAVRSLIQLAEFIGRLIPANAVPRILAMLNLGIALREGLDDDDKRRMVQAARAADPATTKWAAGCAVGWPGYQPTGEDPPIHQIHSRRDWVIRAPDDGPGVELVDGSNHMLQMSHASTVNRFLFDHILSYCPEANIAFPGIEDPHTTVQRRLVLEGAPAGTPLV